jgi:hypothetical protein
MCVAVYIASTHALPPVPWDENRPAFHVIDATEEYFYPRNPLTTHFSQPFFYAAGSHAGCGCGFTPAGTTWNNELGDYEVEDPTENQASRWALADFLSAALRHQSAVEVLVCCSGDESFPPKRRRRARPADFIRDHTLFEMGQVVVVSEQDAEPDAAPDTAT